MTLNRVLLLLIFALNIFIGCDEETNNSTDFIQERSTPIFDSIECENISKLQNFLSGRLQEGSKTVFANDAKIYSDSLLKHELPFHPKFGDSLKIISEHKGVEVYEIYRYIFKIEYKEGNTTKQAYVNENCLVQKIIYLNSNAFLFICFGEGKSKEGTQPFIISLVDKKLNILQTKQFYAYGFDIWGNGRYYSNINAQFEEKCSKINPYTTVMNIHFGIEACGYYTSDFKLIYTKDKFYLSDNLFSSVDADIYATEEHLENPCYKESLKENHFLYYYKHREQIGNEEDAMQQYDSIAINYTFNLKDGWVKGDTLCNKSWKGKLY